jgi:hypothetical protein
MNGARWASKPKFQELTNYYGGVKTYNLQLGITHVVWDDI